MDYHHVNDRICIERPYARRDSLAVVAAGRQHLANDEMYCRLHAKRSPCIQVQYRMSPFRKSALAATILYNVVDLWY